MIHDDECFCTECALRRALERSTREIVALKAELKTTTLGLLAVKALIEESHGVVGLHLNGDVAPWSELSTGGRFEQWLVDFDTALASKKEE